MLTITHHQRRHAPYTLHRADRPVGYYDTLAQALEASRGIWGSPAVFCG